MTRKDSDVTVDAPALRQRRAAYEYLARLRSPHDPREDRRWRALRRLLAITGSAVILSSAVAGGGNLDVKFLFVSMIVTTLLIAFTALATMLLVRASAHERSVMYHLLQTEQLRLRSQNEVYRAVTAVLQTKDTFGEAEDESGSRVSGR